MPNIHTKINSVLGLESLRLFICHWEVLYTKAVGLKISPVAENGNLSAVAPHDNLHESLDFPGFCDNTL